MNGFRTLTIAALMLAPSFASLEAQRDVRRARVSVEQRGIDTTFAFSRQGKISLEIRAGDIRVTGWAKNEVRIVASSEGPPIDAQYASDEISLEADGGRTRFELTVPIGVSVSASSQVGTIVISGTKGEVSVETQSASVEVSDVVGHGDFESVHGRLALQRLEGDISVASMSGSVAITEVKGSLQVETTAGSTTVDRADLMELEFSSVSDNFTFSGTLSPAGRHQIETVGGTITLRFPENFGATLEVSTWNGQFHPVDFPVTLQPNTGGGRGRTSQRQQFTINGGGAKIEIETNSGDVYLRKIGAPTERREQ